jgi:hypothetical protein
MAHGLVVAGERLGDGAVSLTFLEENAGRMLIAPLAALAASIMVGVRFVAALRGGAA